MVRDDGSLGDAGKSENGITSRELGREQDLERDVGEDGVGQGAGEMEIVCSRGQFSSLTIFLQVLRYRTVCNEDCVS